MIRIAIAGDGGVGKTTFLNTLIKGKYSDTTPLTIGIGLHQKDILADNRRFTLQIWDIAGQTQFESLRTNTRLYMKKCEGAILMFDLSRIITLNSINYWTKIIRKKTEIPILLVGSKADLKQAEEISIKIIHQIQKQYNFVDYISISSKLGKNLHKVFEILLKEILNKLEYI